MRKETSTEPGFPQVDELAPETLVTLPAVLNAAAVHACNDGDVHLAADLALFAARLRAALQARQDARTMAPEHC